MEVQTAIDIQFSQQQFDAAKDLTERYERASRRCMMCSDTFVSDWIGNRVCGGCKNTQAWRGQ